MLEHRYKIEPLSVVNTDLLTDINPVKCSGIAYEEETIILENKYLADPVSNQFRHIVRLLAPRYSG